MRKKNIKKIVLLLISIFSIFNIEYINAAYYEGTVGSEVSGGTKGTREWSWDNNPDRFEFRVTLVDRTGKKVQGTKSVDYQNSNTANTIKLSGNELTNVIRTLPGYNTETGEYYYEYKFSTKYSDKNIGNYDYYKVKLVDNYYGSASDANYTNFINDFINKSDSTIKGKIKKFGIENGTSGNFDFGTMFLYHCGFLKRNPGEQYYDFDDPHWDTERKIIADEKYYLLIEPMFTVKKPNVTTIFGTSNEISKFLLDIYDKTGIEQWDLQSAFTYNMAKAISTPLVDLKKTEFQGITKSDVVFKQWLKPGYTNLVYDFVDSSPQNGTAAEEWKTIINPDYNYGVGVIKISDTYKKPISENETVSFNFNYCKEIENGANNGTFIFSFDNDFAKETFKAAVDAGYKFKKNETENGEVYCYDNFNYDFKDLIDIIHDTIAIPSNYVKISEPKNNQVGKISVSRRCYVNASEIAYQNLENEFMKNFSDYTDLKIPLHLYNKTIYLEMLNLETKSEIEAPNVHGYINGIYNINVDITFEYKDDNNPNQIYVEENTTDESAYIDFSNVSYGYSTELIGQMQDNAVYSSSEMGKTYNFTTKVKSNEKELQCPFKTTIKKSDLTTETRIKQKYETPDIQFRTIDLDNPFPARDGSSRLPGKNWLGKDNLVRAYITYNRGVRGNEVYNKEPIYTITLTPSNMVKIREYNKENDYSNIELECIGENNTSCLSYFLINNNIIERDNKDGLCAAKNLETVGWNFKSDPNGIKDGDYQELLDKISDIHNNYGTFAHKYTNDELDLDYNNDKILTLRDADVYVNSNKTTSFYTCADKTYENSGYIRKEQ